MESQEITHDEDVETFAAAYRCCFKKLANFQRKIRLLDDLLQTEQFSMTKLTSLMEDTAAVRQMYRLHPINIILNRGVQRHPRRRKMRHRNPRGGGQK